MSGLTEVITFADLRQDFIDRARQVAGGVITGLAARYVNTGLLDMHCSPGHHFPWAIRRELLITHAPYNEGTVAISSLDRTTVIGSGTLWATAVSGFGWNNVRPGGKMMFGGLNEIYTVASVASDSSLTLNTRYVGEELTDGSYVYFEDEYPLPPDFSDFTEASIFSADMGIDLIGYLEFYRLFPRNFVRSRPKTATKIQLRFSGNTTPQYRVVFSPVPDAEYSIPFHYTTKNLAVTALGVEQPRLINDDDEPIVDLKYRSAIVQKALQIFYRDYKDDERAAAAGQEYVDMMQRVSNEFRTGQDRPRMMVRQPTSRAVQQRRYDVNGRFDRLL